MIGSLSAVPLEPPRSATCTSVPGLAPPDVVIRLIPGSDGSAKAPCTTPEASATSGVSGGTLVLAPIAPTNVRATGSNGAKPPAAMAMVVPNAARLGCTANGGPEDVPGATMVSGIPAASPAASSTLIVPRPTVVESG